MGHLQDKSWSNVIWKGPWEVVWFTPLAVGLTGRFGTEEAAWDQAAFLSWKWFLSVSNLLDLIVKLYYHLYLVLFNNVSEQICSRNVQVGENLNSLACTDEE